MITEEKQGYYLVFNKDSDKFDIPEAQGIDI